jgi:hypothetical protein
MDLRRNRDLLCELLEELCVVLLMMIMMMMMMMRIMGTRMECYYMEKV